MTKVVVGKNLDRHTYIVADSYIVAEDGSRKNFTHEPTVRDLLEIADPEYARSSYNLVGTTIDAGNIDKTFPQLGVADGVTTYLLAVAKADNAV